MRVLYTTSGKLRWDIVNSIKGNVDTLYDEIVNYIKNDVKDDTVKFLVVPNTARLTKSRPPGSSQIVEGMAPNVVKDTDGSLEINLWHIPTLEEKSTPDTESIPIWSMLNWGSGQKVKTSATARGGASISTADFLRYTRPISTRIKSPYSESKPPSDSSDSGFLWRPKLGRGRRGEGYYIPKTTVDRVNTQRALRGKKEKLTTEPMQYYTPQLYIEHSVSLILGKMKTLLSKQNSGLIPLNPIY